MSSTQRFLVRRDNLRETRVEDDPPDASCALAEGEARLAIGPFALTANNITYAAFGDVMRYWQFFPAPEGWGCIPVWGFADVSESRAAGVEVGQRLYGYFPMATHLVVQPARIAAHGFVDGAAHRRELPAIYNQLLRCDADPGYRSEREGVQALLRPLFSTSFLVDDFLAEAGFFAARQVLLSSASSKTAYGTAFCLARRAGRPVRLVGLTSPANLEFTRALGCYDQVLTYDALATLAADVPSLYIDFSADAKLRRAVHEHFAGTLTYSCAVGGTHWQELGPSADLPGPKPTLFFAPAQAEKRRAEWGPGGLLQRIGEAWTAFMVPVTEGHPPWLEVVSGRGAEAVHATYTRLLDGSIPAREGHVLTL